MKVTQVTANIFSVNNDPAISALENRFKGSNTSLSIKHPKRMCLFIQDILKKMFYSTEVKGTVLLLNAPSSQTSKTMTWIPTMLLSTSSESRPPPVTPPIHLELPPITTLSLQSPPPSESRPPPVTPPIHLELPPITTLSLQSPPPSESRPMRTH